MKWFNIESAPKDGSKILVRNSENGNRLSIIKWHKKNNCWASDENLQSMQADFWTPIEIEEETEFSEQFPSLAREIIGGNIDDTNEYWRKQVARHCIDKSIVKEVVTAYLDNWNCKRSKKIRLLRAGILNELGLEQ